MFSSTVDLSPILNSVVAIATAVLSALAVWIGVYLKNLVASKVDLSKTQIDEQLQQIYNEACARGISYAETMIKGAVPTSFDAGGSFAKMAANYVIDYWPDLIKKLGLTPDQVVKSIMARLPSGKMTDKVDAIVLAKAGVVSTAPQETK